MKTYKTLWEKLSKEHKDLIKKEMDLYPNSTQALIDELKCNYGVTYLTLDKAMSLKTLIYGGLEPFDLGKYFKIFDPEY